MGEILFDLLEEGLYFSQGIDELTTDDFLVDPFVIMAEEVAETIWLETCA